MNKNIASFAELRQWLAGLDAGEFIVCFFVNVFVSQDEWMNPLAAYLNKNGFSTVGLVTENSIAKANLSETRLCALVRPEEIMELGRANLFLISDMDSNAEFPEYSKVLGCVHAFETAHYTLLTNYMYNAIRMDALLLPFPIGEDNRNLCKKFWNCFATKDGIARKTDKFYFISVGYPRMHVLADELAKSNVVPDSILYAPMVSNWARELGGNRLKKYGKSIIRTLLENFPDLKVIFRPYLSDLDSPVVKDICKTFGAEPRFVLDDNPGRKYAFEHAKLVISDLSHIVKTFSYATLRPSIYYQPWLASNTTSYNCTYGSCATSLKILIRLIKLYLNYPDAPKKKIIEAMKETVMPFVSSFADIASCIRALYQDIPSANWLTIRRFCDSELQPELDLIVKMLQITTQAVVPTACTFAVSRKPYSALLIAYALHMGYVHMPKTGFLYGLNTVLAQYLKLAEIPCRYEDVAPKIIHMLYARAISQYARQGNLGGTRLVENLLASFEETLKTNNRDAAQQK